MNAGKTPCWNETFQFDINSMGHDIIIQCLDEDMMANDLIGERTLKVKGLCSVFPTKNKIPLFFRNVKSCDLTIETRFTPFANE
jgi:Ca2+-dependent lipid-binding protein